MDKVGLTGLENVSVTLTSTSALAQELMKKEHVWERRGWRMLHTLQLEEEPKC